MQKRKLDDEGDGDVHVASERKKSKQAASGISSAVNDNPPKASLLGLPGELRNRIYRLATVNNTYRDEYYFGDDDNDPGSSEQVPVSMATQRVQPGLLRCCRQLRKEAMLIYYAENRFWLEIFTGKLAPPPGHWFWTHDISAGRRILNCYTWGRIPWGNIMDWLKLYYERKVSPMPEYHPDHVTAGLWAASEAFTLVKELEGSSWEVIEKVLQSFKRAIDMDTWGGGPPFDD